MPSLKILSVAVDAYTNWFNAFICIYILLILLEDFKVQNRNFHTLFEPQKHCWYCTDKLVLSVIGITYIFKVPERLGVVTAST